MESDDEVNHNVQDHTDPRVSAGGAPRVCTSTIERGALLHASLRQSSIVPLRRLGSGVRDLCQRPARLGRRRGAQRGASTSPASAWAARGRATPSTRRTSARSSRSATSTRSAAGENFEKFKDAKRFNDYRKLLDEMGSKIDAVVVSTPDHHHAAAAVTAMRHGQARLLPEAADALGLGSAADARDGQGEGRLHADGQPGDGRARASVAARRSSGRAPSATSARSTSGPTGRSSTGSRPRTSSPGPRRRRAFPITCTGTSSSARPPTGRTTRSITPTTGAGGGTSAPARWATWPATRPTWPSWPSSSACPTRVSAESGEINSETYPAWATITYEFPARGDLPPVKLTWYEGAKRRQAQPALGRPVPRGIFSPPTAARCSSAPRARCTRPATTAPSRCSCPRPRSRTSRIPSRRCPGSRADATRTRTTSRNGSRPSARASHRIALSNFEYASTLTESMLLGNVAVRSGEAIDYDPETGRITNSSTASQYLKPYFRKGWEI